MGQKERKGQHMCSRTLFLLRLLYSNNAKFDFKSIWEVDAFPRSPFLNICANLVHSGKSDVNFRHSSFLYVTSSDSYQWSRTSLCLPTSSPALACPSGYASKVCSAYLEQIILTSETGWCENLPS